MGALLVLLGALLLSFVCSAIAAYHQGRAADLQRKAAELQLAAINESMRFPRKGHE